MPEALIIVAMPKDVDARGVRELIGRVPTLALVKLPEPSEDYLKYFYAPILSEIFGGVDIKAIATS